MPDFRLTLRSNKNCAFLGYYTACSGNSLRTFRNSLSFPFSRVKNFFALKKPICCPETSVRNYQYNMRAVQKSAVLIPTIIILSKIFSNTNKCTILQSIYSFYYITHIFRECPHLQRAYT